ncbi:MAG: hypothetical protein RLZZ185_1643, partial [Bacteroidota bacterium]
MSGLSQYFTGIATKRLSAVETDPATSNQHEFNGTRPMVSIFGTGETRQKVDCTFMYFDDDEEKTTTSNGFLTWYDSRANQPHRSAEYRLYFNDNTAIELAKAGDLLLIGKRPDGSTLALIVKKDTTVERQVLWLFGIEENNDRFVVSTFQGETNRQIGFAERTILETLGIEIKPEGDIKWIDILLEKYGPAFPSTRAFSEYARKTLPDISPLDNPDDTLLAWISHEEMLFRTLERYIVQIRIEKGFTDVDDFVKFSLSVQNRRKSRVGFALENHLSEIFNRHGLAFSQGQVTENRARPDFIFPGIDQYHDPVFPVNRLTMLGSKSTCKDRWRQVLSEANKIRDKHLFTLEPGISQNQTDEMQDKMLQLVLPDKLHDSYLESQRAWLMNLDAFIGLVKERQKR